jgi:Fic family protein
LINQKRMSRANVFQLHRMLMMNQLHQRHLGMPRNVEVTVGGHSTPAPYLALQMLDNWVFDMRSWKKLDPKEMHIRFEKFHPFIDGNGRTGRMLMWWHEMMQGQEPTMIKYDNRWDYYEWFQEDDDE